MAEDARPLIIPFFISHQGCRFRCLFCDQESISNSAGLPRPAEIAATISRWLAARGRGRSRVEVAFFGGSFTPIDPGMQAQLLGAVEPFLADGRVDSVRISTRPDFLDDQTLDFLWQAGVRTVEVGVQSLRDETLTICGRGHDSATAIAALGRLKERGFIAGAQIMLGLPGETTASTIAGAGLLATCRPDLARIYPALVIDGTGLARLWRRGEYRPLSLNRAVLLAARVREILEEAGVRVIRCGLQPELSLENKLLAGPYHPAFGELVYSRILFRRARSLLRGCRGGGRLVISRRDESAFRGRGNYNINKLKDLGLDEKISLDFSDGISRGCVELCRLAGY